MDLSAIKSAAQRPPCRHGVVATAARLHVGPQFQLLGDELGDSEPTDVAAAGQVENSLAPSIQEFANGRGHHGRRRGRANLVIHHLERSAGPGLLDQLGHEVRAVRAVGPFEPDQTVRTATGPQELLARQRGHHQKQSRC